MDGTIGRRRTLKLLGGLAVTGSLAGCTREEEASSPTQTNTASGTSTQTTTAETSNPTTTTTSTETPTATATQTETTTSTETPTETNGSEKGETVSFKSGDGRTVKGTLYGSGTCAVVFAPGDGYDRASWASQANAIAKAGHAALAVSLKQDNSATMSKTLVGAVSYLREKQGAKTVILVGSSSGANAVVQANTVAGANIDGSVIIAPGRAVDYAPELSGRLLFVVGKGDDKQYVGTTKAMHERASKPKRLITLPTDKHGQEIFNTKQGSKLTDLIAEFANTACSG